MTGLLLAGGGFCACLEAEVVASGSQDVAAVRRSSKAAFILASPKTVAHSLKLRLVVTMTLVRSSNLLSRWKT